MTREEIENALLTTGVVDIDGNGKDLIELSSSGKRLTKVLLDHLRDSTVDELAKNTEFFVALEAAFRESHDNAEQEPGTSGTAGEAGKKPDRRTWRLKKVDTIGFGGLNAPATFFEFDVAGHDFCIEGQNGSGKSSLANAVLFAMTGKTHRDQYGLWDDPAHLEPVTSDVGKKLGDWPPIATYPDNWEGDRRTVDLIVKLTFGNESDDEEIVAERRMHGKPGALEHDVSIDPRLTAVPALIETSLLMPMRIQHIRMPDDKDNSQLVGLIRQLLGLEPLLDVADLADKLSYRNQRFLKYAQESNFQEKADRFSQALREAKENIKDLDVDIDLTIEVEERKLVPDHRLNQLVEAKRELDRLQADGFRDLEAFAFDGFDLSNSKHRRRVADAINQLYVDVKRQSNPKSLPPVLGGIASLARQAANENFLSLKSVLEKASADLDTATEWADRQREDVLLCLKAVAAAHFVDSPDPLCPLCRQSIAGVEHCDLIDDLRKLKTDAEKAQTHLADACRRVEHEVRNAARHVVPDNFMRVDRFGVKRGIQNQVLGAFVEATHVVGDVPGFASIAQVAVEAAFDAVEEFEFGSELPEPENGADVGRVKRLIDHLENTVSAAENWPHSCQVFRDAWAGLFLESDKQSLAGRILQLKDTIESVEPFRSASEHIEHALKIADDYNKIIKHQALREKITQALEPLRGLRDLVNLTTRRTIDGVSNAAKKIHQQIYAPEALTYEKVHVSEFRRKQSLTIRAKLGNNRDWWIDASCLANMSWMRGVLWSFVFAIREQAIRRTGHCPFELIVLDDPQMTFDTRNLKGWAGFLGRSDGLRRRQPCQLLVATHSANFALRMTAIPDIQLARIETGQPWSNPAQVVMGDFAAVRFEEMVARNSDDLARRLIMDIRVNAETLLRHVIERIDPVFARGTNATLGKIFSKIAQGNRARQPPYMDRAFCKLIAVRSSNSDLFEQLDESHHSVSETITVREAKRVYQFWQDKLFPVIRDVWEEYRFLQKSIVGEVVSLPANCNHKPPRLVALASVRPVVRGRVSAYADGRGTSAIQIDRLEGGDSVNLSALAAYRLEKDTLSPVARIGDILLTRLDAKCRASNLVVEDRGGYRIARRWHEGAEATTLAVLVASPSNPRDVPPAVISRAEGANRRKIVGILFAAERLQPGDKVEPSAEATDLEANDKLAADLIADTDVFEVQGVSAEPVALDKQFLLAKPEITDLPNALGDLDGKPVIAEDNEGYAYFKRLRMMNPGSVILESLDKTGLENLIHLSTDPERQSPALISVREVVGVIFEKL